MTNHRREKEKNERKMERKKRAGRGEEKEERRKERSGETARMRKVVPEGLRVNHPSEDQDSPRRWAMVAGEVVG